MTTTIMTADRASYCTLTCKTGDRYRSTMAAAKAAGLTERDVSGSYTGACDADDEGRMAGHRITLSQRAAVAYTAADAARKPAGIIIGTPAWTDLLAKHWAF